MANPLQKGKNAMGTGTQFHPQTAKFAATVLQNLPQLSGPEMQYWVEHSKELQIRLQQAFTSNRDTAAATLGFLRRLGTIQLPERTNVFDPQQFFQVRQGLFVWDAFRERIVAAAWSTLLLPATEIASFDLVTRANDEAIQSELPDGHVFEDAGEFCACLAGMLECQKQGDAAGDLITTAYANIFYVRGVAGEVFAVNVYWDKGYREWLVNVYPLNADPWDAGRRVFSRSC